jgi:hypothetical protein
MEIGQAINLLHMTIYISLAKPRGREVAAEVAAPI